MDAGVEVEGAVEVVGADDDTTFRWPLVQYVYCGAVIVLHTPSRKVELNVT